MRAREVVLLIFIIAAGLLLTQTYKGNINWDWNWDDWQGPFFGLSHEATAQESQAIAAPLPEELVVVNSHGDVDVQASADGQMTVFLEKKAYRRTEDEARKAADQLHMTVDRQGSKLVLSTNRDDFRRRNFVSNFRITVPEGLAVNIRNSYGLVKAVKTGRTTIDNSHGPVTASDIRGSLISRNSYDDAAISDVAADCEVDCHHGEAVVLRVKGRVRVTDTYGSVRVEDVGGDVVLNGSHAEMHGLRLPGTVRVETTYRDIALTDVGPATVIGHHSGVDIKGVKGSLDITDSYGQVKLADVQGGLVIHGRSVEVSGRTIAGPDISISTSYQNVDLADFSGKTTVTTAHGNVSLQPAQVSGDITVKAEYAEIKFIWPAGAKNPFEARTHNGEVRWNLSVKPDLNQKNGYSLVKAFGSEQGKPQVVLSTSYADIIIEEAGTAGTGKF
jgi:DUF4097 and DUF4098 domain-containing protein YvlB